MKREIKIGILAIIFMGIFALSAVSVRAEEEQEAAVYAYAVLQDDGELVLINSANSYTDYTYYDSSNPVADEMNNLYVGMVKSFTEGFRARNLQDKKGTMITGIRVASGQKVAAPSSMSFAFSSLYSLETASFAGLDTSSVTEMGYLFYGCNALTSLDVSSFDTSKVTDMYNMFYNCKALTSLDVNSFDTSKVTDMYNMFYFCEALTSLDVSSFDTSKVTNMSNMFLHCKSLTALDLSSFDTSSVENMQYMFCGCSSLISLDTSSFDTSNVTLMDSMFSGCNSLTSLDVSSFDTSNVTNMGWMFSGCSSLTSLDVSSFDTSSVTNMCWMFDYCYSLTSLDLSGFDTSKVTDMSRMFGYCMSLTSIDLSGFNTSKVELMDRMFLSCSSLTTLDVSSFDTSNVENMQYMFSDCSSLISLDLSSFNTSKVKDMSYMFSHNAPTPVEALRPAKVSDKGRESDDGNVTNSEEYSSLVSLNVSSFDTSNVTCMDWMFYGCSLLTSLDLSSFNTSNVTSMYQMFYECSSLTALDVSSFNTSNVVQMYQMFAFCSSLTSLDVSSFDTSKITTMYGMFEHCSSLTSLDLSTFDTSNVFDMYWLVRGCSSLVSLDISSFNTEKVINMAFMFGIDDEKSTSYLRNLRQVKLGPGFTVWRDNATLPSVGVWTNEKLGLKKTALELYQEYPSHAEEWAGTWEITGANALPFVDVPEQKYFYAPVKWAYYHIPQITSGVDDTHFGPELTCTRSQVVTFLWRANGCPEPKSNENPFTDVRKTAYYYKAVLWAVEKGITTGIEDGKFGPGAACTRGQVVTFMYRANGEPQVKTTTNPFKDVKKSAYYYKAVLWAYENDITSGTTNTTFSPNDTCTRGQIVTFLHRNYKD